MSYCHLRIEHKLKKANITLPQISTDYPLKEIKLELEAWKPLVHAGYLPFGDYEDGWGPICFDLASKDANNDYSIVWFDHEVLLDMDDEEGLDKSQLNKIKKIIQ